MKKNTILLMLGAEGNFPAGMDTFPGVKAERFESIVEAIQYLKRGGSPDAFLCAYHLNEKDGIAFYQWLRSVPVYDQTPFLLFSEQFSKELYNASIEAKIDDYYAGKNISCGAIMRRIAFLAEYKSSKQERFPSTGKPAFRMPLTKRVFDVVAALTGLILVSPVLLLASLAISLE